MPDVIDRDTADPAFAAPVPLPPVVQAAIATAIAEPATTATAAATIFLFLLFSSCEIRTASASLSNAMTNESGG